MENVIYGATDIMKVLNMVESKWVKNNKKIEYLNVPLAFDIETSSFLYNGEKTACMYIWQFGIDKYCLIGRTWEEFEYVLDHVAEYYETFSDRRVVIYVHNLAYEFQFIRKRIEWENVFSIDQRRPIYALATSGIEFRCSYLLSNMTLEKVGENLQRYKVKKMVGDLDYTLIRNSATPLTEKEIGYCVNDVFVLLAYIRETIEDNGDITKIPLTNTGYVRNYTRKKCFVADGKSRKSNESKNKRKEYFELMQSLQLECDEYMQLKRAFAGGFTHASVVHTGTICHNVASYDFTSSYPAVMLSEKYPMGRGQLKHITNKDELKYYLKHYCCVFDIKLINVLPRITFENYISESKCIVKTNVITNNGRVVSADELQLTVTNVDFEIIERFYIWDSMTIGDFRIYDKGYLPKPIIESVLQLYQDKTTLKGVSGKEVEYLKSKGMLNSVYGMSVTDIVRDENVYENDSWSVSKANIEDSIEHYNKSKNRFLFYPWGVFVTAYARRNLFTGIIECGHDYIYSDTDSIKMFNREKHLAYFDKYNENITKKCKRCLEYYGLDTDLLCPKTIKGVSKPIGVWDYEGTYELFKTLGAKRYMLTENGNLSLTVSGVNKKFAIPYMLEKYGDECFLYFDEGLEIPKECSGKMTHTYIDEERSGYVTDYLGNTAEFRELSSVHLENASYSLSIAKAYKDYIMGFRELEI